MSTGPSATDLAAKSSSMKKVETKTGAGLDPAAVAAMEKVYTSNGNDLAKAAASIGVSLKAGASVKDASDFAKKILQGTIVKD